MNKPLFVYKYDLPVDGDEETLTLRLPAGAEVLCIQVQREQSNDDLELPRIWVKLDPTAKVYVKRRFEWYGTGQPIIDGDELTYVGTIQTDGGFFIWHLFERK